MPRKAGRLRGSDQIQRDAGEIALTGNEYRTTEHLRRDYWRYVVYNCSTVPDPYPSPDPMGTQWTSIVKV